jgi:hypothetical protein
MGRVVGDDAIALLRVGAVELRRAEKASVRLAANE